MVTVASVKNLQVQIALAERQVAKDQSQVDADTAKLNQSQSQLDSDQRELGGYQDSQRISLNQQVAANTPTFTRAIAAQAVKAPEPVENDTASAPLRASVNTQGETIGKLINVTA